jgi:acetyl-CoA/propionyl-CoA carboxylase biotin carboxyl carrier protein
LFKKILIANRGEIAIRIMRACRELDVTAVAVYSDADREALHATSADEAFRIGPPPAAQSYLNVERLMEVARTAGCDAVHPGYGFLAENADFARRCAAEGLAFVGPSPESIERMGNKIAAREAARSAKVPVVPGTTTSVASAAEVREAAKKFGYPIAVKAAAGGGGKGLRVAHDAREVDQAVAMAVKEGVAYFNDGTVYVERYFARPKHVEVQILADRHGHVIHLGERDCSLQRRHQKLVEETPANIAAAVRSKLHAAAVKLAKAIGYDSAGTIECLVDGDDFYFLEMNTRIQVEHTITEAVWGIDLVKAQIRIAAGERLWLRQDDLSPRGHAIECRINAESPLHGFAPSAGKIGAYVAPAGPGVRVDAAAYSGWTVRQEYDSLLAKLIAWGVDREEARRRMLSALREFKLEGVQTTIPFFLMLLADDLFVRGDYATPDVETFVRDRTQASARTPSTESEPTESPRTVTVEVNDKRFEVRVYGLGAQTPDPASSTGSRMPKLKSPKRISIDGACVTAPMHGIVAEIKVEQGDAVADGQVVAVIEAMKMMNEVVAHRSGTVKSLDVRVGDTLETGAPIITFAS